MTYAHQLRLDEIEGFHFAFDLKNHDADVGAGKYAAHLPPVATSLDKMFEFVG